MNNNLIILKRLFSKKTEKKKEVKLDKSQEQVTVARRGRGRPRKEENTPKQVLAKELSHEKNGRERPKVQLKRGRGRPKKEVKKIKLPFGGDFDKDKNKDKNKDIVKLKNTLSESEPIEAIITTLPKSSEESVAEGIQGSKATAYSLAEEDNIITLSFIKKDLIDLQNVIENTINELNKSGLTEKQKQTLELIKTIMLNQNQLLKETLKYEGLKVIKEEEV